MAATFIIGDVRDTLAAMPDASVDLVLTSPPFLALRSYLPDDHPDKHREIGAEPSPAEFLDTLLGLTAEWQRVLAPHGSIAVELGDTYAGSGSPGGDYNEGGMRAGQPRTTYAGSRNAAGRTASRKPKTMSRAVLNGDPAVATAQAPPDRLRTRRQLPGWPEDKSLCLIPELYRLALAYGINPLTGSPSPAGQWKVRNVVRWCRPNPPVGALGDKFRPGTSDMVIACTSRTRYFDLDAVRTPLTEPDKAQPNGGHRRAPERGGERETNQTIVQNANGAPPLDWWKISTEPYGGSHYATWPTKLLERPIKAMCPTQVCRVCGEPSRRIVETSQEDTGRSTNGPQSIGRKHLDGGSAGYATRTVSRSTTLGWTDCGHDDWRPGLVLDPFAGSGTTLAVATGHGRHAIGIDIDARNADLALDRVGPLLLTVTDLADWAGSAA